MSVCVFCVRVCPRWVWFWFGLDSLSIKRTRTRTCTRTSHARTPVRYTLLTSRLSPLVTGHEQIASLWSPPPRRAIHVCITIFQHIWARTRSAITHHPHQHQHHHPRCRPHRPHSWPHRWPSNSWAARLPPWHRRRSWPKRCAMRQVIHSLRTRHIPKPYTVYRSQLKAPISSVLGQLENKIETQKLLNIQIYNLYYVVIYVCYLSRLVWYDISLNICYKVIVDCIWYYILYTTINRTDISTIASNFSRLFKAL